VPAATGIVSAARVALADAQDELDAAQAAHAKLQGNLPDLEDALRATGNLVTVAVNAVIRAGTEELLGEAEELRSRLERMRLLLRFVASPEMTPADTLGPGRKMLFVSDWDAERLAFGPERGDRRHYAEGESKKLRDQPFAALADDINRFLTAPAFAREEIWNRNPVLAPFQQARIALCEDADSPLPTL
jgi:hypothetical protein